MAASNHRAMVVPVVLEPHPEADRLSIVTVNAYTCVVATEDWQGVDKAVYIAPDTVVPDTIDFAFLKRNNSARAELSQAFKAGIPMEEYNSRLHHIEDKEATNTKNLRITARRLRGVQSFGMLWPLTECPLCKDGVKLMTSDDGKNVHFIDSEENPRREECEKWPCLLTAEIGDDVWNTMGFQRYDPPLPAQPLHLPEGRSASCSNSPHHTHTATVTLEEHKTAHQPLRNGTTGRLVE